MRTVIIGAGPTGLCAGYRLAERGESDFVILEASDRVGGLAGSYTDDGFTYDVGGHVMFSHYPYYDRLIDRLMGDEYTELQREAWVWMEDRFIPYPFQNNVKDLKPETVMRCILGLIAAQRADVTPTNFSEWVYAVMGDGIAEHFMLPYNWKVWAQPLEEMAFQWIGERVSVVGVEQVLRNVVYDEPQVSWGPNSTFRYPLRGGTGFLWDALAKELDGHVEFDRTVASVDVNEQTVTTTDGRTWPYDALLSTMPLNRLIDRTVETPVEVRLAADELCWSGSHIVGVGIDRPANTTKNWVYYPEPDVPFYRVTYLSNYSPHMTARPGQTLLLTETSVSDWKPEPAATIVARVIDGLRVSGLLRDNDDIVTTWRMSPRMTYPVPTLGRDAALRTIQPWLRSRNVWSRGRFGAWLYEVGNMDHSGMMGVEFVDNVLDGAPEKVWQP